jgi:hypothetical protein
MPFRVSSTAAAIPPNPAPMMTTLMCRGDDNWRRPAPGNHLVRVMPDRLHVATVARKRDLVDIQREIEVP